MVATFGVRSPTPLIERRAFESAAKDVHGRAHVPHRALLSFTLLVAIGCGSEEAASPDAASDGASSAEGSAGELQGDAQAGGDASEIDAETCATALASGTYTPGACTSPGLNCSSGCHECMCTNGQWSCGFLDCANAGGCPGGAPPLEGASCGGCCSGTVGGTCVFACPGDAGQVSATCEAPGAWHLSGACTSSDGAAAEAGDAATDASTDAACIGLFQACTETSQCCTPYACINITGTLQCQLEGPAIDAGR